MKPRSRATSTSDGPIAGPAFRFVGGKGGVGKTTCAAGIAVSGAREGHRTLLVSTDPASSLSHVLACPVGRVPREVPLRGGRLFSVAIDAPRTLAAWLSPRIPVLEEIALRGTWLDRDDVSRIVSQTLPGVDELAALLEIARLATSNRWDLIVVDTAPTGHTLRMLAVPQTIRRLAGIFDGMQAKHRALADALGGGWRADAADALIEELDSIGSDLMALLRDPARVRVSWVTLPEPMAVEETRDAIAALRSAGIPVSHVIVNRVTPPPPQPCRWCWARRRLEERAVGAMERTATRLVFTSVEARAPEPRGTRALLAVGQELNTGGWRSRRRDMRRLTWVRAGAPLGTRRADLPAGDATRLLLFGGKGGVGKTTCAAATALELADRFPARRILLISTDPAHSLGDALGKRLSDRARPLRGGPRNLDVRELDAAARFAAVRNRYRVAIDALFDRFSRGSAFDVTPDRLVMHDLIDLAPPGIDELAAVIEVTDAIAAGGHGAYDLVVMDTAPTGHALRLLEMPAVAEGWVKALMAVLLKYQPVVGAAELGPLLLTLSRGLGQLRKLLADSSRTRFVAVTRAEGAPAAETLRLLARLSGLGVSVPLVVVNALGAGTCGNCRRISGAQRRVLASIVRGVRRGKPPALALAPAVMPPPFGLAELRRWRATWVDHPGTQTHGGDGAAEAHHRI